MIRFLVGRKTDEFRTNAEHEIAVTDDRGVFDGGIDLFGAGNVTAEDLILVALFDIS